MAPRVAILANASSGALDNRALVHALTQELAGRAIQAEVMWKPAELLAAVAAPDFASQYSHVVAAGGDGTVSLVINLGIQVPLLVFPLGNENLVARCLGHTADPQFAASAIESGRTKTIDLGRAGDRMFGAVASAGFDADVVRRLCVWRERGGQLLRVRSRTYAGPILAAALKYPFPLIEVEIDGQAMRGAMVMVFNLPRYGGGLRLAPHAICDDGLLDWLIFERPGRFNLARYAASVLLGAHLRRKDVRHGRATTVRLSSAQEVPLELDGDAAGLTPVTIQVAPGALRVVATADATP